MLDDATLHPDCRTLLAYWQRIHPSGGGLPGRRHFDPAAIPALLPHLMLADVHHGPPLRFRYRLVGTQVDAVLDRPLTGCWLDEAFDGKTSAQIVAAYRQVVETRAPFWRRGRPRVVPSLECTEVGALRLPLAADGQRVDMILSMNVYLDSQGRMLGGLSHRPLGY